MDFSVYPYLISVLVTAIFFVITIGAFLHHRSQARQYEALAAQLPAACQYANLLFLVEEADKRLESLRREVAGAEAVIKQKQEAEIWLVKNRQELELVAAERARQDQLRIELAKTQAEVAAVTELYHQRLDETKTAELQLKQVQQDEERAAAATREHREQLQQLMGQLEQTQQQKAELTRNIGEITALAQTRTREVQELQAKIAPLQRQLEQDTARLASTRNEFEVLSAKVNGLTKQEEMLRQVMAGLQDELKGLRSKAGQTPDGQEARLADLWKPVLADGTLRGVRQDELACLQTTTEYLRERGLRFPDRVLKAFHTSLKVADISPLVVLAGISGTGKSELPRRYAEGMGLHFLNIAVQPRWDSPQDMFGFFNYLEGRYRATELARALVQMDPYYKRPDRGWNVPKDWDEHSLKNQMLLVLLDEMNLARIEYYFSEFLSRLEVRRGVDHQSDQDRRKAEIPLEVGLRQGSASTLHLFVDSNVLFVGTMNEDETTQSLSDKVVDRANVLRFGKPANMTRQRGKPDLPTSHEHLPYVTWRNWIRKEEELSPEQSQKVDEWIGSLNDAMSLIHRPFAYRTHMAIRAYVANYPGIQHDPDGLGHAMADQIEQKILSKFRGLDTTDSDISTALQQVVTLLNKMGDPHLVAALTKAIEMCRRSGHQFVWLGLDRNVAQEAAR